MRCALFIAFTGNYPDGIFYGGLWPERGIMSVKEFAEKARKAVQKVLGDQYFVDAGENLKLNDTKLWSINIHSKNRSVAPVIFLDSFFQEYEQGKSFDDIVDDIVKLYWEYVPKNDIDLSYLMDYEKVKDKICLRLCNYEKNSELLKESVYIPFLDLAVMFYIKFEDSDIGRGQIRIRQDYLERWGITTEDLMKDAKKNSEKEIDLRVMEFGGFPMYVMSNKSLTGGASSILYPDALEKFASRKETNLFVIPSSVHEVILIPDFESVPEDSDDWTEKTTELKKMISQVNREELRSDEVLSDNLYYFDRSVKRLKIV